jgi:hypothetical protein
LIPVFEFVLFCQDRERRQRATGQKKENLRVDARERAGGPQGPQLKAIC